MFSRQNRWSVFYGRTESDSPAIDNDVIADAKEHYIKIHDAGDYDLHGTPVTKVEKPIPLHQKINNQNPTLCRIFLFNIIFYSPYFDNK
jgi:hypothetical protein